MITFYEMLQLIENDDWRDTRKDVEAAAARANASREYELDNVPFWKQAVPQTVDELPSAVTYSSMTPDSGFERGAAVPRGRLASGMKDQSGKRDAGMEVPNPTKKRTNVNMSTGYNMSASVTGNKRISDAIEHLGLVKQATPDKFADELKKFLTLLGEIEDTPGLHPKVLDRIETQKEAAKKLIDRETRTLGVPAQDSPRTSPMTKYMAKKHSKVF